MQLKEIMTPDPEVIRPEDTIQAAAQRMRDLDVGLMPVCDGKRLKGMLTDRDLATRAVAEGLDPKTAPVSQVMSDKVIYTYVDEAKEIAAGLMQEHQIRRLIVVDRDKELCGIVSLGDLATKTEGIEVPEKTLDEVSTPSRPER